MADAADTIFADSTPAMLALRRDLADVMERHSMVLSAEQLLATLGAITGDVIDFLEVQYALPWAQSVKLLTDNIALSKGRFAAHQMGEAKGNA